MENLYIGIDNGKDGAIVAVDEHDAIIYSYIMPVIQGKRRQYNIPEIADIFRIVSRKTSTPKAVLEKVQIMGGKMGTLPALSMGECSGLFQGILCAFEIPYEIVAPKTWQKAIFQGGGGDTKAASIQFTQRKQPGFRLQPTQRSKKPHDGLADAYCMAVYCRRLYI